MTEFFKKTMGIATVMFIILAVFSFSNPVFAELKYTPLAPLPGTTVGNCATDSTGKLIDPNNCKTSVSSYIPSVFRLSIAIAGILAVLMMVVGGIQYLSTDAISGKEEGKEKIQNALWGFLLAIGAFIILNTINPGILSLDLGKYSNIKSAPSPVTPKIDPSPTCAGRFTIPGHTWCNDALERAQLEQGPNPVAINKGNCQDIGQSNCTSVFQFGAILSVKSLKQRCDAWARANSKPPCNVTITGGTEYWLHGKGATDNPTPPSCVLDINCNPTGHKPGGRVVDLSISDPSLNSFITKDGEVFTSFLGCASGKKYLVDGKTYVDEKGGDPHYHVCY